MADEEQEILSKVPATHTPEKPETHVSQLEGYYETDEMYQEAYAEDESRKKPASGEDGPLIEVKNAEDVIKYTEEKEVVHPPEPPKQIDPNAIF